MSKLTDLIGQFVTVPVSVLKLLPSIGVDGLTLFVYLRWRTNSETDIAFPSYDRIQTETTLTRRRIAAAIRSLEKAGILERKRRFSASTLYTLRLPEPAESSKTAISANGRLMDSAISTNGALMDSAISADARLPLVQAPHAIKINSSNFVIDIDSTYTKTKEGLAAYLVKAGCSRRKAAEALEQTPWDAERVAAEIRAWQAYAQTKAGENLEPALFPYLIAARIRDGQACPQVESEAAEVDPLSRYDGYLDLIREQAP